MLKSKHQGYNEQRSVSMCTDTSELTATLATTKVFTCAGTEAGKIEELLVDPYSGIVRFASIRTKDNVSVLVPWTAMLYTKSQLGFMLTLRGELMVTGQRRH